MTIDLSCPACAAPGRELAHVVAGRYRLLRCTGCGTEFLRDPAPPSSAAGTDSEYWEDYKFAVYASPDVRRGYEERYAFAFGRLAALTTPPSSVLDVGCGIGNFLDWSAGRVRHTTGVDVDAAAVDGARQRGLTAVLPDELDTTLDGQVDVLTMWDVIEHVADPHAFVGSVVDRLRPGGYLLLETPDAAFPVRPLVRGAHRLTGGRVDLAKNMYYWEHKIYFTEEGLRRLLRAHGCELVEVHRLTSPVAKMQATFDHLASDGPVDRLLAQGWPVAEQVFRRLGRGNKLVAMARRTA